MSVWERAEIQKQTYESSVGNFANKVYSWMTIGLVTTALVAFFVVQSGLYAPLMNFWLIIVFGTMAVSMGINAALPRLSFSGLAGLFILYSVLQGLFFGTVLPLYAAQVGGQVIWMAFLTAAVIFGTAVVYGAVTKSDLTSMRRILTVALFGLIALSVLYMIMSFIVHIPGLILLISYIGLVIFVGLTAYDAQQIRRISHQVDGNGTLAAKMSLMMAMKMYLNVLMIFWYLLQIFSSGRRR